MIAAAAILGVLLLAAVVAVLVFDVDIGQDDAEAGEARATSAVADELEIAARFAPILRQHSRELFLPIDRRQFVTASVLRWRSGLQSGVFDDTPTVDALPETVERCPRPPRRGPQEECAFFLDIPRVTERSPAARYVAVQDRVLDPTGPTVQWHVVRYDDTQEIAVQYWFLYLFNNFENQHESDWEQITIRLDPDRVPLESYYSSHEAGETRSWEDTRKIGERAVVFPAGGSHANYFENGNPTVILKCHSFRGRKACVRGRTTFDHADGCGRVLVPQGQDVPRETAVEERCADSRPVAYVLKELGLPSFVGSYAPGNRLVRGLVPAGANGPGDPQRRTAWTDPLGVLAGGRGGT